MLVPEWGKAHLAGASDVGGHLHLPRTGVGTWNGALGANVARDPSARDFDRLGSRLVRSGETASVMKLIHSSNLARSTFHGVDWKLSFSSSHASGLGDADAVAASAADEDLIHLRSAMGSRILWVRSLLVQCLSLVSLFYVAPACDGKVEFSLRPASARTFKLKMIKSLNALRLGMHVTWFRVLVRWTFAVWLHWSVSLSPHYFLLVGS
jgi:hypothetical protein